MWNRMTERARRVIYTAGAEAEQRQETILRPEHILLGLLHPENDGNVAAQILDRLKIAPKQVRTAIPLPPTIGTPLPEGAILHMSDQAKRVIDLAWDEAGRLGVNYLGTEHLLLGLIRAEEELEATGVLQSQGVDLEQTRRLVIWSYEEGAKQDARGEQALQELRKLPAEQAALLATSGIAFSDLPPATQQILEIYLNIAAQPGRLRIDLTGATIQLSDHDTDAPASHHIRVTGGTVIATLLEAVSEQTA